MDAEACSRCELREVYLNALEVEKNALKQRLRELKHASRGTILNEDGDPLYALIPLRYLESL